MPWKNGVWYCYEAVSFDLVDAEGITTPDCLLGMRTLEAAETDERAKLRRQHTADARPLNVWTLKLVVGLVRTVIEHRREVGASRDRGGWGRRSRPAEDTRRERADPGSVLSASYVRLGSTRAGWPVLLLTSDQPLGQ